VAACDRGASAGRTARGRGRDLRAEVRWEPQPQPSPSCAGRRWGVRVSRRWEHPRVRRDRGADEGRPAECRRAGGRLQVIERRRARRAVPAEGDRSDDGLEGLRGAAGGRGTFARIDERGARPGGDDEARAPGPRRLSSRGLVAELDGFNLHAGVCTAADDRDALERLCRYMARPAVASGRVSVLPDGNVAYRVKSPRSAKENTSVSCRAVAVRKSSATPCARPPRAGVTERAHAEHRERHDVVDRHRAAESRRHHVAVGEREPRDLAGDNVARDGHVRDEARERGDQRDADHGALPAREGAAPLRGVEEEPARAVQPREKQVEAREPRVPRQRNHHRGDRVADGEQRREHRRERVPPQRPPAGGGGEAEAQPGEGEGRERGAEGDERRE